MDKDLHLYATPDDLPEYLRGYVKRLPGSRFTTFHHPFLVDIFPLAFPARIEDLLELRKAYAENKLAAGSLAGYIFAHQRPYRLLTLIRLAKEVVNPDSVRACVAFWKLAASVWMDAEESEDSPLWSYLLAIPLPFQRAMMTGIERRALRAMPEQVDIYRGLQAHDKESAGDRSMQGYSWTLSPRVARFFAERHLQADDTPWVAKTTVKKSEIVAFLTRRNEEEVLINSDALDPDAIKIEGYPDIVRPEPDYVALGAFFSE